MTTLFGYNDDIPAIRRVTEPLSDVELKAMGKMKASKAEIKIRVLKVMARCR